MIKVKLVLSICFLLMVKQALSQGTSPSSINAFKAGEQLRYSLKYGFVTGGYITFSVTDTVCKGVAVNQIDLKAKTAGIADAMYKIRDRYASFIDVDTDLPVKSIRDIREGKYRYYNEVTYNQKEVVHDSIFLQSKRKGEVKVPSRIQDILSAFYYARKYSFNDGMRIGEILDYNTYFGDEIFPLRMKYIRKETIKTNYGKMECFLFYPVTEVGRAFKTEEDMKVWISRDDNRIPVRVKVNLKVGSFICDLIEFKGLSNPFSAIRN